eukprot:TRINITY_DN28040_c0_g1_i1.p1 TRINITY_DN28040_c0_g1~~TRINITY_DN28040_c0_g1_i1.p1  ORF type:complete len:2790 (+),score=586.78 TRINITY_DN28040_c0_g1_i1:730-8370(+)
MGGDEAALPFMLSPLTLTRASMRWRSEVAAPVLGSLLETSGYRCAWSLNLCATAATYTTMDNFSSYSALVDTSRRTCSEPRALAGVGDWASLAQFLATQFFGLHFLNPEVVYEVDGVPFDVCEFITSLCSRIAEAAPLETLANYRKLLGKLSQIVHQAAGSSNMPAATPTSWPMRFPALATTFILPIISILNKLCGGAPDTSSFDLNLSDDSEPNGWLPRGVLWVLASMWRLHSGGGALVPGGVDHCEAAAELRAELQSRCKESEKELQARSREELAVDADCAKLHGAAADLTHENLCWGVEAKQLDKFCLLRPPLAFSSPPGFTLASLPSVSAVTPCTNANIASFRDLCEEVVAFAGGVVQSDRVLRMLLAATSANGIGSDRSSGRVLAELHNLTAAALSFAKRIQDRFPLHSDLVKPICLAAHGIVHGLHVVHRHAWFGSSSHANSDGAIGAVPQAPEYEAEAPAAVLGEDVAEDTPEIACWWLRWAAVNRMEYPRPLLTPRPVAALRILQSVSRRHFDMEEEKAQEEVKGESLYKMAKAACEDAPDEKEADEAATAALFPGADQLEVSKMLGLDDVDAGVLGSVTEADGGQGGGGMYDIFGSVGQAVANASSNETALGNAELEQGSLSEKHIFDLCALSLSAFLPPSVSEQRSLSSSSAFLNDSADAMRAEALDCSLELFVRKQVASLGPVDAASCKAALIHQDVASKLAPMVLLRLQRAADQLKVDTTSCASFDASKPKRVASQNARGHLHGDAATDFYSDSNPATLLHFAKPLTALLIRTRELLVQFEAHPALLALEGVIVKIMGLRLLKTTPMAMVTMVELLLGRAAVWEESACREVSISAHLRPLETMLVNLREKQLLEWRDLRRARERHWERQGAKWWLHVVGFLADAKDARTLVDELLRFLRVSPLGQFRLRHEMLHAAARLYMDAEGPSSSAGRVAMNAYLYARRWLPIVGKALTRKQEMMEKEMHDLVKIVRWDISNYHALKESVTRSHRQIARAVKRFDEALQEYVDPIIAAGSGEAEGPHRAEMFEAPSAANFLVDTRETSRLAKLLGLPEGAPAERFSDTDAFWSSSSRVAKAAPSMLSSLSRVISAHILDDTFCFSAPEGYRTLEVGSELCEEMAAIGVSLLDSEQAMQVKKRRLHNLREELGRLGFAPRPLLKDAFDVTSFFSSPMLPSRAPVKDEDVSTVAEPPLKRPRLGSPGDAKINGTDVSEAASAVNDPLWRRLELLTCDLMHLALRVHSIKDKPNDMSSTEIQLWLGLAVASMQAARMHHERCTAFQDSLQQLSAHVESTMQGLCVAVPYDALVDVMKGVDRLLEGSKQMRLVVTRGAGASEASTPVRSLDETISAMQSLQLYVRSSGEFEAYVGFASCAGTECARVRLAFLRQIIERLRTVLDKLAPALQSFAEGSVVVPAPMLEALKALGDTLRAKLQPLQVLAASMTGGSDAEEPRLEPAQVSWHGLRSVLLVAQRVRDGLQRDASLSISAAAPAATAPEGAEEEEQSQGAVPRLGAGKGEEIRSLLHLLPLPQLKDAVESSAKELPAGPHVSPIAPFARQMVLLGDAVMRCGLEASLATFEISVGLLRLVAQMLEKGLGAKTEEKEGEGDDDQGGKTEWAAGTGMGEGEGQKDVSEEIKDDQQLDGMEGEQQQPENQPKPPEDGKEDTAREVGFDFDAEQQNAPQPDQGEGAEPPEKEKQDDMDRQAGDVDLNAGGQLEDKLWNGDDDKEDDDKGEDDKKDDSKKQEEEIEAHGAKGEGEADQVADEDAKDSGKDGKEDSSKQHGDDDKGDGTEKEKDMEGSKDKPELEEAKPEETEFTEKDAQFDVNMQPDGRDGEEGGDGDGAGSEAPSDIMPEDGDLNLDGNEGEGDGDDDKDGEGGSEIDGMDEENIDESVVPEQAKPEDDGEGQQEQGVDVCMEGDGPQPEEQQQEQPEDRPPQNQAKNEAGADKTNEPPREGDPDSAKGNTESAPQPAAPDEKLFGGSSGQSTNFESQAQEQDGGDAQAGAEQGGAAPTSSSHDASMEAPSNKAQQQRPGSSKEKAQPTPEPQGAKDAEEKRLQKVDVLRDANESERIGGTEEDKEAEKGMHLSDPKSGAEALGECTDPTTAPQQAMGAAENEGEENDGDVAAKDDDPEDREQDSGGKQLPGLTAEHLDDDAVPTESQIKEKPDDSMGQDKEEPLGTSGSREAVNMVKANVAMRPSTQEELAAEADVDMPDVAVGPKPKRRSDSDVRRLWSWLELTTAPLAASLCEQLRIILEPTLKGRLQGHYKTGKRISMRKVIPFIASNYRRDKIWLRRTKPSKREYQVLVAIDNSRSMHECGVGPMALQTLSVVCQALARLEVGEYGVLAFGSEEPRVLLPLGAGQPHATSFGLEQAAPLLSEFTFQEESVQSHNRSLADMLQLASRLFDERSGGAPSKPFCQVQLIISDGRFSKAKVRPWVHAALARQQLPLLIIVDGTSGGGEANAAGSAPTARGNSAGQQRSVFDLKAVSYEGGRCNVVPYLQDFPFPYYVVVQDLRALPNILSDVLKQWFELATSG